MSSYSPGLHGVVGPITGPNQLFSPADFGDAEDQRPTAVMFDIIGNGNSIQYTTAVNGILTKHIDEVKQKVSSIITIPGGWKRKLRDFLGQKNTELLDFLKLSVQSHHTLSKGDLLMKRFGLINSNQSNVREYILDISGVNMVQKYSDHLSMIRSENGLKDYIEMTRYIFEQYREAGDEALLQEQILRSKLDIFDKIQSRLTSILDIDTTSESDKLFEVTEMYVTSIFEKNQIKEAYLKFIEGYRRFISLRDVVLMTRTIHSIENEPLCGICFKENVSYTISPCGHTYCLSCSRRQSSTCFICRGSIRDKIRIFFN
jgi:hypothetical protein